MVPSPHCPAGQTRCHGCGKKPWKKTHGPCSCHYKEAFFKPKVAPRELRHCTSPKSGSCRTEAHRVFAEQNCDVGSRNQCVHYSLDSQSWRLPDTDTSRLVTSRWCRKEAAHQKARFLIETYRSVSPQHSSATKSLSNIFPIRMMKTGWYPEAQMVPSQKRSAHRLNINPSWCSQVQLAIRPSTAIPHPSTGLRPRMSRHRS